MLNKDSGDTRSKILKAAFELFGRFGFEGTSVRDISAKCGVNVSAVNYHFENKENLFWEIMLATYSDLDREVEGFFVDSTSTIELALKTFDHFLREKFALQNTMKMMLSEGITPPSSPEVLAALNNPMGPPGGKYFAEMIQREISYELSREGLLWGIKAVFGVVFHWSTMCCADKFNNSSLIDPLMTPEQIRKDVEAMVKASLQYLASNQALFSQNSAVR